MEIQSLVDNIGKLTLVEAAELVKALEDKLGVKASAPVAAAAAGPAAAPAAAAAAVAGWVTHPAAATLATGAAIAVVRQTRILPIPLFLHR